MCEVCIKRFKNLGGSKKVNGTATYGQIKALAHSFDKHGIVGVRKDRMVNLGVEAHLEKIHKAIRQEKYNRNKHKFPKE